MKLNSATRRRIPNNSYQVVINKDNSIDIYFSDKVIEDLKFEMNKEILILTEYKGDEITIIITNEQVLNFNNYK